MVTKWSLIFAAETKVGVMLREEECKTVDALATFSTRIVECIYNVSQKTSHLWLAITLMHMNGCWYFLAEMLPIK